LKTNEVFYDLREETERRGWLSWSIRNFRPNKTEAN